MFQLEESSNQLKHTASSNSLAYPRNDLFNKDLKLVALEKYTPGDESTEIESRVNELSLSSQSNESHDPLANLPENWMSFDFKRKKSCVLSNIYSTCVTKAINHLEALQNSIDKWMNSVEKALPGSASSAESAKIVMSHAIKSSLRTKPSQKHQLLRFKESVDSSSSGSSLGISGVGAEIATEDKTQIVVVENKPPVEDLKAYGIVEEILLLLVRLEHDRRRTESLLKRERENLTMLKGCIENLALKRAVELPLKVQKEHDACITDITELNWHISFNTKAERKLIRKVEIEERLYEHLKEQISTIKNNTPLIEEKIRSELVIIEKITSAQNDVDDFVAKAKAKLAATQEKTEQSYIKAAKEREAIQADLASCKRELNKAKKRLQEAEDNSKENQNTLEDCVKKMEDNLVQEKLESTRRVQLRAKNEHLNDENKSVQVEIFRVDKEIERVTQENIEKNKKIDEMSQKFNEELEKLNEVLNKKIEKLEKVLKKLSEKQVDMDEMAKDQANMEHKIEKDERNRERLLDERGKVEEELKNVTSELEASIKMNLNTQNEFERETRRLEAREDVLMKQINDLRKQISEERHQLTTLVNRMSVEWEEYQKAQGITEQKKIHFEKKKIELEERLETLIKRVEEIEKVKIRLDEEVQVLTEKLNNKLEAHKSLEANLKARIAKLEPEHANINQEYLKNKYRLEYMKNHSNEMNTKMTEMAESKKIMVKTIEKTNHEIEELELIFKEVGIQLESSQKLDNDNKKSLAEVIDRIAMTDATHAKHMQLRSEYSDKLNNQLEDFLKLNKELASRYRYLKYYLYNMKLDLMQKIEFKLSTYVSMKDKRQLISLQERMHNALEDFFKYKISHSEKNFSELNSERDNVGDEMQSLENMLYQSINHVSRFLHNQIDFSHIRQQAMQKVYKQELIEQQEKEAQMQKANQNRSKSQLNTETLAIKNNSKPHKTVAFDLVKAV